MLIGAVVGLLSSFIPELLSMVKARQQHKQELEMLEMQLKYQREMTELKIEEAKAVAQLELDKQAYQFAPTLEVKPTGKTWLDALQIISNVYNQTVRPTITYLVILGWLLFKYAQFVQFGGNLQAITQVWTDIDSEFVGAIIAFWFGNRAMLRTFGKVK
ncbi:MAG: hypothetical protein QXV73_03890 [Candidatus Micrarchaeia archaeon]